MKDKTPNKDFLRTLKVLVQAECLKLKTGKRK